MLRLSMPVVTFYARLVFKSRQLTYAKVALLLFQCPL
jgi:hypothetical protein